MKKWEAIQSEALGANGVVTLARARNLGVSPTEIYRWCNGGRLIKVGRAVFRLTAYPSRGDVSDLTALVAQFGDGAFLYGESALALYGLCPTRPYVAAIASPRRIRMKTAPAGVSLIKTPRGCRFTYHEGVACQKPQDAIRACIGVLETGRLADAIETAVAKGLFAETEAGALRKEIEDGKAAAQRT